jgi:hypothetical protein
LSRSPGGRTSTVGVSTVGDRSVLLVAVAMASSLECVQVLAEASLQGCVDRLFVSCRVTA